MKHTDNILKGVKDFELAPPADAYTAILSKIKTEDKDNAFIDKIIGKLANYGEAPPETLYSSIQSQISKLQREDRLKPLPAKTSQKSGGIIYQLARRRNIAAAVLGVLVFASIIIAVKNLIKSPAQEQSVVIKDPEENKHTLEIDSAINPNFPVNKGPVATAKKYAVTIKKLAPAAEDSLFDNPKAENFFASKYLLIDGQQIDFQDNDIVATFANFKYDKVPAVLLNDEMDNVSIQVDDYTAVGVSKNMRTMMKKMYSTKRNGNFTRKAKRYKKRLANWVTADSLQFDKSLNKNPLDPVDLGEFIFFKK